MFGSKNPLNAKSQTLVLRDFDSAAAEIKTSVSVLTSSVREELSFIEHVREQALNIVADLADAVTDGTLDEGELPSDRLDFLILEATDGADDDENTLENAVLESIADALATFGVDDSVIEEMMGDNIDAADAAIEADFTKSTRKPHSCPGEVAVPQPGRPALPITDGEGPPVAHPPKPL